MDMTEDQVRAEIRAIEAARENTPYTEGAPAILRLDEREYAARGRLLEIQAAHEAATTKQAGMFRIKQPAAVAPEPAPEPITVALPEVFARYERTIESAQAAAKRANFSDLPAVLALFGGIQRHEGTPTGATDEERLDRADQAFDALVLRHGGEERANEIIAAWREAVQTLGLARLVRARGWDAVADAVDEVGRAWLRRKRGA